MYRPGFVPQEPARLPDYIAQEQEKLLQAIEGPRAYLVLQVTHTAPPKPFDGMEVLADGTNWNPGSGAGRYYYLSNSWHFMG